MLLSQKMFIKILFPVVLISSTTTAASRIQLTNNDNIPIQSIATELSKTFETFIQNIQINDYRRNRNALRLFDESLQSFLIHVEKAVQLLINETDIIENITEIMENSTDPPEVLFTTLENDVEDEALETSKSVDITSTRFGVFKFSSIASVENQTEFQMNETSDLIRNFLQVYPIESWQQHGYFTIEYLSLINPHWLQFEPAMNMVHYVLGCLYVIIFGVGVSGNFLVIYMFIRCRSLRTPANTLIINLAVSDLLMMSKTPIFIYNSFYFGPALGSLACETYGFIGGLTGTVSIVTLAAISIDRFLVIVYPLDPNKRFTGIRTKICVITIWVYGSLFSTLPLLDVGVGKYIPEGLLTSCSFDYLSKEILVKKFIVAYFFAAWVLPFCIIVFCYTKILSVVIEAEKSARNTKNSVGSISSRHCKKDEEKRRTEIKLAGVVVIVILLWFLAWTPYAVVALLGVFGYESWITPVASMVPALFCKFASCIDPFIYAVTHPRFRTEIKKMCSSKQHRRRSTFRSTAAYASESQESIQPAEEPEEPEPLPEPILRASSIEEIMIDMPDLGHSNYTNRNFMSNVQRPPSWYVKPSFTRENSLTSLKRKLTIKRAE